MRGNDRTAGAGGRREECEAGHITARFFRLLLSRQERQERIDRRNTDEKNSEWQKTINFLNIFFKKTPQPDPGGRMEGIRIWRYYDVMRMTDRQRSLYAEKAVDLANIAAGALIFGQFLSDGRFNLRISVFIISSFHLSKNH